MRQRLALYRPPFKRNGMSPHRYSLFVAWWVSVNAIGRSSQKTSAYDGLMQACPPLPIPSQWPGLF